MGASDERIEEPSDPLVWRSHPFRRRTGVGLLVLGLIFVISIGLVIVTQAALWGILAFMLLFLSLEGFFFPTEYQVGTEGVKVRRAFSRSSRSWESFRRVYEDRHGLTLSPYRRRSPLEPYRALRLLFDGGDETAIRGQVRGLVGSEIEWIEMKKKKDGA